MMNPVLQENKTPHRWRVVLVGHIDDMELAVEALQENLVDSWIGFVQDGDNDEAIVTITLKWLDPGMLLMVQDIIDTYHEDVRVVYNGGVDEHGDRVRT
jgi:hypothetical protein